MSEASPAVTVAATDSSGMAYLNTIPRRVVTIYIPLALFVILLLFPFYWMGVTTFKPNDELYNFREHNPFWVSSPTLNNVYKLFFQTDYPQWLLNTMVIAVAATVLSIFATLFSYYGLQRRKWQQGSKDD